MRKAIAEGEVYIHVGDLLTELVQDRDSYVDARQGMTYDYINKLIAFVNKHGEID